MNRRAAYMYGAELAKTPEGQIGAGLGMTTSTGTVIADRADRDITRTGQEETVDGVRIVFQITPGTEAPAEMNFYFPDRRALCMAENATHNLHNLLTLRGALVRDPRIWARYLNEAIELFGDRSDVAFASHHWPTWGHDNIIRFLSEQRDLYAYLHDQTLRLLNQGYTGPEIAEMIQLPPGAGARLAHPRLLRLGQPQRQGHLPALPGLVRRQPRPPVAAPAAGSSAPGTSSAIGGIDAVVAKARQYADAGDLRFAAELLNHAVFADPGHAEAKELLADVLRQARLRRRERHLAQLLPDGRPGTASRRDPAVAEPGLARPDPGAHRGAAVRLDRHPGQRAEGLVPRLDDRLGLHRPGTRHRMTLSNGALIHWANPAPGGTDLTLTLTKPQLLGMLAGNGLEGIQTQRRPGSVAPAPRPA